MTVPSGICGRRLAVAMLVAILLCGLGLGTDAQATANSAAPAQQTIAEKIAESKDLLDINTATSADLKALPGMGEAYAQRVIAGRPYTAKNQLTTRGILPPAEYQQIKDQIIAHRPKP